MYIPAYYKNENITDVTTFIHENGFALLISQVEGRPWATHIPLLLDRNSNGQDTLVGHISRANFQWKAFAQNEEVLVVFSGPHAYISPSWYDHVNVPTWNYLAVHVYGKINIIEGEPLKDKLSKLVDKYENNMSNPVSVNRMPDDFIENEMKGIIGFEILITEIQAAKKLSQNRDEKNYENIIHHLEQLGDKNSKEIAKIMKDRNPSI